MFQWHERILTFISVSLLLLFWSAVWLFALPTQIPLSSKMSFALPDKIGSCFSGCVTNLEDCDNKDSLCCWLTDDLQKRKSFSWGPLGFIARPPKNICSMEWSDNSVWFAFLFFVIQNMRKFRNCKLLTLPIPLKMHLWYQSFVEQFRKRNL